MVTQKKSSKSKLTVVRPKKTIQKTAKAKAKSPKKTQEELNKDKRYYEAVGRRKRATARVRLFTCRPFEDKKAKIEINQKAYTDFFPILEFQQLVASPLQKMKSINRFKATIRVKGGGIRGQAEAIRHGMSRALVKFNPDFSKKLKRAGFLSRDPREVERKKPGLKKARRAPQWRKR
ncbi:MAG: 30S ribosomal protein S9 [Candidatus Portnoybacteria bacterium CG03_land_8_20_14_0_80_41_10]|uniref:Small ribosomal subunit protein uS9 n=1 Tax=Candidatus Portnoybacteria bacterium CG03_land_8_20_14_0_80_41_10 TaxID=1974808 RepID=A0A2M7BV38_9BACT|nr:MAG: 30S ribosomal protein S9 [Candidatus Portnoybacteria bacterium CG03_land_8_20_14_0_80_41_10]